MAICFVARALGKKLGGKLHEVAFEQPVKYVQSPAELGTGLAGLSNAAALVPAPVPVPVPACNLGP